MAFLPGDLVHYHGESRPAGNGQVYGFDNLDCYRVKLDDGSTVACPASDLDRGHRDVEPEPVDVEPFVPPLIPVQEAKWPV